MRPYRFCLPLVLMHLNAYPIEINRIFADGKEYFNHTRVAGSGNIGSLWHNERAAGDLEFFGEIKTKDVYENSSKSIFQFYTESNSIAWGRPRIVSPGH
jgi:hypothetical protein